MDSSLALPAVAGVVAAFLVNYLADELPRTRRLSHPTCRRCGQPYGWLRYLTLQRCGNCGASRTFRTWLVIISLLAGSLLAWAVPSRMGYWLGLLLQVYFGIVVVIDLEHRLILQPTSLFGAILSLGIGWWLHGLVPTLLGGLAGFAIMTGFYYFGVLFTRLRARRRATLGEPADHEEALGGGDVNLAAILGLLLGWPLIWFGLLLGVLFGGLVGLIIVVVELLRGRYGREALNLFMPYGPGFVASAFLIMFLPNVVSGLLPG